MPFEIHVRNDHAKVVDSNTGAVRYEGTFDRARRAWEHLTAKEAGQSIASRCYLVTTRTSHTFEIAATDRQQARRRAQLWIWENLAIADHPVTIEEIRIEKGAA